MYGKTKAPNHYKDVHRLSCILSRNCKWNAKTTRHITQHLVDMPSTKWPIHQLDKNAYIWVAGYHYGTLLVDYAWQEVCYPVTQIEYLTIPNTVVYVLSVDKRVGRTHIMDDQGPKCIPKDLTLSVNPNISWPTLKWFAVYFFTNTTLACVD